LFLANAAEITDFLNESGERNESKRTVMIIVGLTVFFPITHATAASTIGFGSFR
jgi:hypothetical protein